MGFSAFQLLPQSHFRQQRGGRRRVHPVRAMFGDGEHGPALPDRLHPLAGKDAIESAVRRRTGEKAWGKLPSETRQGMALGAMLQAGCSGASAKC